MAKKSEPKQAGEIIISQIIGEKPRIPQTYAMRSVRATEADLDFCKNVDDRIAEWNRKADEIRNQQISDRAEEKAKVDAFEIKKVPPITASAIDIYSDFLYHFKNQHRDSKDFNPRNPYSDSDEPKIYVYTLIFYFMKDKRFFDSPLLRKDLSIPSFNKGTLTIGDCGCGKSSVFFALLSTFKNHIDHVNKLQPSNLKDLIDKYRINQCISTDIVNQYRTVTHKKMINEILQPLMSSVPLYIDDILREVNAGFDDNVFLRVLIHRSDWGYKSHLTLNPSEDENEKVESTEKSILQFKTRYDKRVYDRAYGDFNIIELIGKTFRR